MICAQQCMQCTTGGCHERQAHLSQSLGVGVAQQLVRELVQRVCVQRAACRADRQRNRDAPSEHSACASRPRELQHVKAVLRTELFVILDGVVRERAVVSAVRGVRVCAGFNRAPILEGSTQSVTASTQQQTWPVAMAAASMPFMMPAPASAD